MEGKAKSSTRSGSSLNGIEPGEIGRARAFIHEHLSEPLSLTKVAKAACISPNYLSEKFRACIGETLVRYIARRRVERARELLRRPDYRMKEIAYAVGFQSISQFNRSFKRLCGCSPTGLTRAGPQNGRDHGPEMRGPRNSTLRTETPGDARSPNSP